MNITELRELSETYVLRTYGRLPIGFVRGEGARLWDTEGKVYLDFLAGIAVCGLGHCHPELVAALTEQAGKLWHTSNLYYIEPQAQLARKLVENSVFDQVFFCNSGAEANEAAIKLARKYGHVRRGQETPEIIATDHSFHGRTLATVTATGQPKYHKGFEPLVPGFVHVPYNDLAAARAAVTDQTCAFLIEPIQGESGIYPATPEYLQGLRALCDERNLLLIADEVQTGMGRTGKLFAYEHYGIEPDVMTLAKCLGGGFPLGAMLTKAHCAVLEPGNHASTFGGNFLATAVGNAVMDVLQEENLVENAAQVGEYFRGRLRELQEKHPCIVEVRGKGVMNAIQLNSGNAGALHQACLERGLIINAIGDHILRFQPPLIITPREVNEAIEILDEALTAEACVKRNA
jgi:predicted acetylornithine/succinylornithine family transaminase